MIDVVRVSMKQDGSELIVGVSVGSLLLHGLFLCMFTVFQ